MHEDCTTKEVGFPANGVRLSGFTCIPGDACGLVIFAHGSGSGRHSPRNRFVAWKLAENACATLLFDLLTVEEARDRARAYDIELLADRMTSAAAWARRDPATRHLALGFFGASTGAAAALVAAARAPRAVAAVVSRGGRPDLAGRSLARVAAPTLLIVGSRDLEVLGLNRDAQQQLRCEKRLDVIDGATHLFEEPGALEQVADTAAAWFVQAFQGSTSRPEAKEETEVH